jgi:hypothetical protein
MPNSYRLRTEPGVDKDIQVLIDQDFDFLEILSLKITQSEIYARMCSDYGVVVGRVIANNGYGVPNARVSIFIPLSAEDENNPIISTLYPYKTLTDKNVDGYRYNLLPYTASYSNHNPTGTFPDREDVLINKSLIEVYDKYYKFTVRTNESGDFMIFGVPVGSQTLVMDLDLSDMGPFSLSPQDLIRMGIANETQVNGTKFNSSTNLDSLPQLVNVAKEIEVLPFWGQPEVCQLAITRTDFDLVKEINLDIEPTAIFMGSLISTTDKELQKKNCKPRNKAGELCRLVTGPGEIVAIRQTIFNDTTVNQNPILEQYGLESGGKVIDENGTWLIDLPMNMDYIITDEFGNQVISNDPKKGIPTKAKYRFKIKWQQSDRVSEPIKRGYFLVPNIREYWNGSSDPGISDPNVQKSYAFSLDWNDYADIQSAINCDDTFYEFKYNKVYTISQLITEYRNGTLNGRFIGIKNITDDTCQSENNPFPANDGIFRLDIIYLLFLVMMYIFKPIIYGLTVVAHLLKYFLFVILGLMITYFIYQSIVAFITGYNFISTGIGIGGLSPYNPAVIPISAQLISGGISQLAYGLLYVGLTIALGIAFVEVTKWNNTIMLPMFSYPDCEICSCNLNSQGGTSSDEGTATQIPTGSGFLFPFDNQNTYTSHLEDQDSSGNPYTTNPWWGVMLSGMKGIATRNIPETGSLEKLPGYYHGKVDKSYGFIGTSLPIPELINLFNLKSKYFDTDNGGTINGGGLQTSNGGWNQIKVSVQPTINPPTSHHYDKPLIIVTTQSYKLKTGEMISFQNPQISLDPNLTGGTFNPDTGINAISGTVINKQQYTITYANPTNENDITPKSTTYNIIQTGETLNGVKLFDSNGNPILFHKFQTDLEYFQVITGMTYSDFKTKFNPNYPPYSFLGRIEGDRIFYYTSQNGFAPAPYTNNTEICNTGKIDNNSLTGATDLNKSYVYILFRGVDPYSTRQDTTVDLSRIFGYNYGGGPIVNSNYKLNWPIQPSLRLPEHTEAIDNLSVSSNPNSSYHAGYVSTTNPGRYRFYFPSLSYQPNPSLFTAFTSSLHSYYSNLSQSWNVSVPTWNGTYTTETPNTQTNNNASNAVGGFNNGLTIGFVGGQGELRTNKNNLYTWYMKPNISVGPPYLIGQGCPGPYWCVGGGNSNGQYWYSQDTSYKASVNSSGFITSGGKGKGYWCDPLNNNVGEYLDGGSFMGGKWRFTWRKTNFNISNPDTVLLDDNHQQSEYYSFIYNSGLTMSIISNNTNNNIVMRSDRLPSSTSVEKSSPKYNISYNLFNDYLLHQNANFVGYQISDDGQVNVLGAANSGGFSFQFQETNSDNVYDKALNTFSCGSMVPLGCYSRDPANNSITTGNLPGCLQYKDKDIFIEGSCYKLVTKPVIGIINDLKLISEWQSRLIINFAGCRDVFSHLFVNNWINGTLYAFSFRNDTTFDQNNQPVLGFCEDTIVFHGQSNSFYYRSSPYNSTNQTFVGKQLTQNLPNSGYNKKSLQFPTTIIDLGPRNDYLNEITYSTDYDGYLVDRLNSTTFGDTSELLNYFIISRLINLKFIQAILGTNSASIFSYFTRFGTGLPRIMKIDSDFAQLISINSELGVAPFESEVYPDPAPGLQPPVYYNGSNSTNGAVIGVFYSSDTQTRDYVTPRRQLINPLDVVPVLSQFQTTTDFYYIGTKSQEVPFYKWNINDTSNSIFGNNQKNDWETNLGQFFSYKYQDLDRLVYPIAGGNIPEQYMMSSNATSMDYFKGYIYAVDSNGNISPAYSKLTPPKNGNNSFLVGAPLHFYFGLKQGKTAFNRFSDKWIKPEVIY